MSCVCRAPEVVSCRYERSETSCTAGPERNEPIHPSGSAATRERVDACLATSVYSDEEPCRCAI
jgi:hypothetical protein